MQIKFNKILKWLFFFSLCLVTVAIVIRYFAMKAPANVVNHNLEKQNKSYAISYDQSNTTKKQKWEAMEKEVNSWVDGLGLGIDPGIKKTVIVLNLLDFKTEMSCEGHIDRGTSYPWVRISTENKEIVSLRTIGNNVMIEIEKNKAELQAKYPDLTLAKIYKKENSPELIKLYEKYHEAQSELDKLSKRQIYRLQKLLNEFYKTHSINADTILTLHEFIRETYDLLSLGFKWQLIRDNKERLKKLKEYQQEMKLFTEFLTDYYFAK